MKRIIPIIASLLILLTACSDRQPADVSVEQSAEAAPVSEEHQYDSAGMRLMGLIIEDDGSMGTYMMMHGFLRTAENLGYPAKLYRITSDAAAAVAEAIKDGCSGLLIPGNHTTAIAEAAQAGIYVVSPYYACETGIADVNVVADSSEYIEELARGIAERMTERSLKSGRILIYGYDPSICYAEFDRAIEEYYPQFQTVTFVRTPGSGEDATIAELADYILNNRDIKGMYACDTDSASIAVNARSKAISLFKEIQDQEDDDKKKPTPTPSTAPSAESTPNPGLLKQISITAFGCGLSDENLALFNDNDIYALCIEPYYETAATATMMLDRLFLGEETAENITVNRPIAYADSIDKYLAIYNEVKELFALN
ncbi:MAG: hypothetical protein IJC24_02580 [Clostridia bacterium]|nr:hypothetical protein [Clostridia bacterium]